MHDPSYFIDLNCDLGESYGVYSIGNDEQMMPYISSANIACGFHGGDASTMRRTIRLCLEHGVAIGAHPGLPDLHGFGRRNMALSAAEVYDIVLYQIGALAAFVRTEGGSLHHVKLHGALYHMANDDAHLSKAAAEAIYKFDPELIVYGLQGSAFLVESEQLGLRAASEGFVDRGYDRDGSLLHRTHPQALITNPDQAAEQATDIVIDQLVKAHEGMNIPLQAHTLCIHGDHPQAIRLAEKINEVFAQRGVIIRAV